MPFVRKKSWEEHVTNRAGLQYSHDDLDVVCCHGIGLGGPSAGTEISKSGRRERCSSLPGRCHQVDRVAFTVAQNVSHEELVLDGAETLDPVSGGPEYPEPLSGDHSLHGEESRTSSPEQEKGVPQSDGGSLCHLAAPDRGLPSPCLAPDPVSQALVQVKNIGMEQGEDSNGLPDEVTTTKLGASVDITNASVHLETREPIGTLPSCCDTSLVPSTDVLRCIIVTGPTANSFVKRRDMEKVDSQSTPEEHRAATAVQDIMQEAPGPTGKEGQNVHHDQACTVTEVTLTDEALGRATQGTSDHVIPISNALTGETSHEVPGGGKAAENGEFPNMDTFHQVPSSGSEDGPKMSEEGEDTLWNIDPVIEEPTDESGAGPDGQRELRVPAQEISHMVLQECDNALGPLTEVACPSPKGGFDLNAGVEGDGTLAVGKPKHPSVESSQTLPGSNESALRTGATNEVPPDRMPSRTENEASNATLRTGADFRLTGRKSEDGAVKLRISKKWSKEEREWSRLDSMVLLIMKLDQLDQDIEDALSATPIALDTPLPPSSTMPGRSEEDEDEAEAKEACDWLQAAGFPQYAQLYEDAQFPIEISSVTRDHDFLDRDAIEALCRRLDTLNKCAMMRLEISQQRKRNEDSDEDEPCAISRRWTFQRDSKRWSRLAELEERMVPAPRLQGAASAESLLTDLSEQPEVGSLHSACSSSASVANEDSLSEGLPSPPSPPPPLGSLSDGKKGARSKARSFLKRMESLRLRGSSSRRKKKAPVGRGLGGRLEISGPVLRGGFDEDKLRRLNCVDIASLNGRAEPVRSHSISYCTQTSSSSSGSGQSEASGSSSQSEAGSGGSSSAVSTPSPVTRARSHSTAAGSARSNGKRGGLYLEGLDLFSLGLLQDGGMANHSRHCWKESEEEEEEEEVMFFFIPEDHKPGTFPKALCNGRLRSCEDSPGGIPLRCGSARRQGSSGSLDSRLSFYDNVPQPAEEEEEVPQSTWAEGEEEGDSDSALDSASPCPSSPRQGRLGEADNGSDLDSTENALSEQDEMPPPHERRDSGVGASLTRPNRPQKLRWHSFQSSHRPSLSSMPLQIGCQSVVQMNLLQKFSLLKLTALMERNTPTNKHGFSWAVPKFMKRTKVRDPKGRSVFGVPLQANVRRTGQPLPQGIQQAMRYLRGQCLDQVGLFRKSGVKSRIQALREMNEACSDGGVSYEGQSAYDVADMLKQYFRDLPEPLFTNKLSDTFLQIYQYLPRDQRLQAVKAATLLLPDENREALQALLYFLSDVAASVGENQMTATNLAVCLAPSLFHLNGLRKDGSSPRVMHRKQSLGKPDQKDLNENRAATHGLAHMITECKELFQVPEEMSGCRHSYAEQGLLPPQLQDLGEEDNDAGSSLGARSYLRESLDSLLKEAKDKFRGYDSCPTHERVELAYRKVQDGSPLRLWKVAVEVPAAPEEVLTRLLRDRHRWDEDLLEARVVETLDERTEVYQYVQNSMAPQPPRDHVVLRTWVTDLSKGACAVVCASVEHEGAGPAGVRANVHTSRYYLEPCGSAKTRLTHISRIDCRGHVPEWYNKAFGHLCATEVARIRDSFASQLDQ